MHKVITATPQELWEEYKSGKTLEEVAAPRGVSRERIRQILSRNIPEYKRNYHAGKGIVYVRVKCAQPQCKESFMKPLRGKGSKKRFCNKSCTFTVAPFHSSDPRYQEWRKDYQRILAREWYWNVFKKNPRFKEIVSERNRVYALKRKQNATHKRDKQS